MNRPRRLCTQIQKYSEIQDDVSDEQENCPTINQLKQKKKDQKIEKTIYIETVYNSDRKFNKARYGMVNGFSKFQMKKDLTMQSLFLAVDIFDRCRDIMKMEEMNTFALVSIMLAMKYEQIYPPSIDKASEHFRVGMSFRHYVSIELQVLNHINFNLNFGSPIKILLDMGSISYKSQEWFKSMLLLEIAATNNEIKSRYSWDQIVKAIMLIFNPLNFEVEEEVPEKITLCCKKMMIERSRLQQNYVWLYNKYMNHKFSGVAAKTYAIRN